MKRIALLAFAIALGACTSDEKPVQPRPNVPQPPAIEVKRAPVTTDRERYRLHEGPHGPETTIVSTYTAPADHDVYLLNCNGTFAVGLQRPVGEGWEHVWAPAMNACMSAPIVIRAGTSYEHTMVVQSGAGTYRVIWHGLLDSYDPKASPPGPNVPVEQRVSAPISIEAATPKP